MRGENLQLRVRKDGLLRHGVVDHAGKEVTFSSESMSAPRVEATFRSESMSAPCEWVTFSSELVT